MQQYKFTFTAGTGVTHDGSTITSGELLEASVRIRTELANRFGGYTETSGMGGWVDDNGHLVEESSRTWECITPVKGGPTTAKRAEVTAQHVASFIAGALLQASVMNTATPVGMVSFTGADHSFAMGTFHSANVTPHRNN